MIRIIESDHYYIYRIIEPDSYRGPILINNSIHYYSTEDKYLDPITHKIEFYSSNIYSNIKNVDSNLIINLRTID